MAVLIAVEAVAVAFVLFCLADLARAEQVRYLPRWAWAVICMVSVPLGGIIYLAAGRVRTAREYRRGYRAAQSTIARSGDVIWPALGDQAGEEFDLRRWAQAQRAAVREASAGVGPFQLPAWFTPLAGDLGSLIDPVGYEKWSFMPTMPFIRGYQAALRDAGQPGRAVHGAAASGPG